MYQDGVSRDASIPNPATGVLSRLLHPAALAAVSAWIALLSGSWWALHHLAPDSVSLELFGRPTVIADLHRRLGDRVLIAGILAPGVFLLEYLWMGWAESSIRHLLVRRTGSGRTDIVCFVLGLTPALTLLSALLSLGVVVVSGARLRQALVGVTGLDLSLAGAPLVAQTAALFVFYSLFDYWGHRLDHSRLFWPLHRFHHSADDFSVLTAARVHPAVFTAVVATTLPGVLLGASPEALADINLAVMTLRLVIHSRIESDFGWAGRWIVQSPRHHRLHHNLNRLPVNLGLLPVWDRLFGTWREAPAGPLRIGSPTPYRHGAWILPDIWRDYCEFWSGLARLFRRRPNSVANELQS